MSMSKFQQGQAEEHQQKDSEPIIRNTKYLEVGDSWIEKLEGKSRKFKNKHKKKNHFIRQKTVLKAEKKAMRVRSSKNIQLKRKNALEYKKILFNNQLIEQSQLQQYDQYLYGFDYYRAYQLQKEQSVQYDHSYDDYYDYEPYYEMDYYWDIYDDFQPYYPSRSSYSSYDYGQRQRFGEYRDSSYPWWNPTGLNTWERMMYDFD